MVNRTMDDIWKRVLGKLERQVTRPAYETWVKGSEALKWSEDGRFVVGVRSEFARDWIESRLQGLIERIFIDIVGHPVRVTYVVAPPETGEVQIDEQGDLYRGDADDRVMAVKFFEFDPTRKGFLLMSKYAERFWQPLLGVVAYATYRFLRTLDRQNEGWGKWHFVNI